MYSRYKIQMPAPPPDYAGTAFKPDSQLRSVESPESENPPPAQIPVNAVENPREVRWEEPQGGPLNGNPDILPDEPLDPDFTLPPEAEFPEEEIPSQSDSLSSAESATPQAESDPAEGGESAGSLLAGMDPDDLLFIGAMLYLLSGKTGNDSFLLLAYLLTCGL